MHGKVIQFKADIVLDKLNEISSDPLMVNLEASQTEMLPEEIKNNA